MRPDPDRAPTPVSPHAPGPICLGALIGLVLGLSSALPAWALAQEQARQTLGAGSGAIDNRRDDESNEQQAEDSSDASKTARRPEESDGAASPSQAGPAEHDGPSGKRNTLDPQDRIVPSLVRKQQQQYHRLRDQVWNARHVPAGLMGATGEPGPRDSNAPSVALEARNVDFYLDDDVGYHIIRLKAELIPVNEGEPVDFDDPEQYRIHILSGKVLIRPQDLDALFNNYILTYEPRALSRVKNRTSKDRLSVTVGARLFRFIPPAGGIPTTLSGPISVTDDNLLSYEPTSVEQMGLPVKPLLSATGLTLATMTPFDRTGVKLEGNRLLMNPETVFPPPRLKIDRIEDASLTDDGLLLTFASDASDDGFDDPPVARDSYIWLQSGDARFYSVLLVNANLELVSDNDKPLDFSLYHYRAQAAAGTIRARPDGALIVRVPNAFERDDNSPKRNSGLSRRTADNDPG